MKYPEEPECRYCAYWSLSESVSGTYCNNPRSSHYYEIMNGYEGCTFCRPTVEESIGDHK